MWLKCFFLFVHTINSTGTMPSKKDMISKNVVESDDVSSSDDDVEVEAVVSRAVPRRPLAIKKARVTKSTKGGLVFPVGRVHRHLRSNTRMRRVAADAGVYLAGVLEYLTADLVETCGLRTKDSKRKRITPRDILFSLREDEDMFYFTRHAIVAQGGVLPYIHKGLLPPAKNPKKVAV